MTELILPWPSNILSPNGRHHWAVKAKAVKSYREAGFYIAKQKIMFFPEGNISVTMIFHPPNKGAFDIDGMSSRMKSALDGIADAWKINDKRFRPITTDFGDIRKHGEVIVRFA